ncbi:host specificity factor TipJ family phage tail protein [Methylobacterium sp. WL6]|uniref:host specificity factor TipJ family phage tail protein n=1 Tax=Methylobacterium sp. WL6 TaxID=2603901 RepID=UPI0011C88AB8|nr:host specificity factor TipJ family phage tail protein [Methylobacterium sp. WL6]TXN64987.1 phage tail protein [Methylobacterium sp. WL6]
MSGSVAVVARPSCLDALLGLVEAQIEPGASLADMIAQMLPQASGALRDRLRVTVGGHVILPALWEGVRPKAGSQVLIQAVPGGDLLRSVLTIAITVAAVAAGQFYAPALLSAIGVGATATTTALASAAISGTALLAGTLLLNALVPPSSSAKDKPVYSISGLRNQATPDGVIPLVLGFVRYAPPYAAIPYTQAVGDYRYVVASFLCGYGPLTVANPRIGETPIERYGDVELEVRGGYANDDRLALYPQQVVEEPLSIELLTALVPTGGPQIRTTAADCTACEIDVTFPGGVFGTNKDGGNIAFTVGIATRYRKAGTDAWVGGPAIVVTAKKPKALTRTSYITFPERGRYEIELTRITTDWDEADQSKRDKRYSGRSAWSALRSIRPEYPIDFDKPLALAACRIRATGQLNGMLDALNFDLRSICPDWDEPSKTWITRETNNPAALFRYVLTGPAISYPLPDDEVAALGDWHAFCAAKGLTYNRVHDFEASVLDVLVDIAAAGRATPRDTGTAWGVVVDRALATVSAHITPRNSWGFKGERPYAVFPDAFRIQFQDETNGFSKAERVVPWPGFAGSPKIVEELKMPGVTNPDMIWREGRRRQYELIHRPDTYTFNQDMEAIACGRGDRVLASHDVLDDAQVSARVKAVDGARVILDELVSFETGVLYAVRFRRDDGSSLLRSVKTGSGETQLLTLDGPGDLPEVGNLALFGVATRESFACTIKAVEGLENLCARLTLIDHAPEIEALVDAELPPAWSGRAGDQAQISVGAPQIPIIVDVISGRLAASQVSDAHPYPVVVLIQAPSTETQTVVTFAVRHRIAGATAWSAIVAAPAAAGAVLIDGYAAGDQVQIQAASIASQGTQGVWTTTTGHVVAATDPAPPSSPTALTLSSPGAGTIEVTVTSSPSEVGVATAIYLASGAAATFSSAHAAGDPIASGPNTPLVTNLSGLATGTWRVWAIALDGQSPPSASVPAGPSNIQVS